MPRRLDWDNLEAELDVVTRPHLTVLLFRAECAFLEAVLLGNRILLQRLLNFVFHLRFLFGNRFFLIGFNRLTKVLLVLWLFFEMLVADLDSLAH